MRCLLHPSIGYLILVRANEDETLLGHQPLRLGIEISL